MYVTSLHRNYVIKLKIFFLPKAFLIWLKFLAVCLDLNFRTKGQDALIWRKIIAEICLDMTSFSYVAWAASNWRKFLPEVCLDLTKILSFFLVDVECLGLPKFSCGFGGENIFEIVLKPESKAWNCWNMKYF